MTALYEDTAQLPAAREVAVVTLAPPMPPPEVATTDVDTPDTPALVVTAPAQSACRAELRAERLRARRHRRLWVGISFAVMGTTLGATVAVLEFLH